MRRCPSNGWGSRLVCRHALLLAAMIGLVLVLPGGGESCE